VPADAQTRIDSALSSLFPPASLAPGRTNDDRSSVDANFQLAYKGLTVNGRLKDEHSGSFIGPGESLGSGKLDTRQLSLDVGYRHPLGGSGSILGKFSFTQNEIDLFLNIAPPGLVIPVPGGGIISYPDGVISEITNHTRRFSGETILDYRLFKDHQFTLGFGFTHVSTFGRRTRANYDPVTQTQLPSLQHLGIDAFPQTSRNQISLYAQDIWKPLPDLDITAGIRHDHYSDIGDTVDPRIGAVWRFAKDFHLKLLYGSAFRAPSILETSYNVPNGVLGNPNLDPSKLHTFEAAVGYIKPNRFQISANYFATFIRDFIRLRNPPVATAGGTATFANEKGIDIQGVEIETRVNLWDHTLFANYTFQHPTDKATGRRLPDVPSHLGSLGLSLSLGDYFRLTPSAILRGSRPRAPGDPRTDAPGYAVFNLTLEAKTPIPGLELSGTIKNLFDKSYSDPAPVSGVPGDYPRPGRSFFLKAIYKF
jgi:iron complex outermembrane receptor protein